MQLSEPDHIVHTVPYLLGFHPKDSIVLIWIRDDRIVLTQRYDRAAVVSAPYLHGAAVQVAAQRVIICGFTEPADIPACRRHIRQLAAHFEDVVDAMVICQGRRWCAHHVQHRCPSEGHLIDPGSADEIACLFIAHGVNVQPDRQALVEQVAPDDVVQSQVDAMLQAGGAQPLSSEVLWRVLTDADPVRVITPSLAACMVLSLNDIPIRDGVLHAMAISGPDTLPAVAECGTALLRMAPPVFVANVATVCAVARWLTGDGARAWACLDRAEQIEPEHRLSALVSAALSAGMPPSAWRAALTGSGVDTAQSIG